MNILHGLLISVPLAMACSRNVYTPPARPVMLTSAQTANSGATFVRAYCSTSSEMFGPSINAGTVGVRHGLKERLEVVADASYAQVGEKSVAGTNRGIAMARVGVKFRPNPSPHIALVAGAGGGYSPAAGVYSSVDAGAVIGYENRYIVPFVAVSGFASIPLNARQVDITTSDDDMQYFDSPEETVGLTLGAGLRVPLAIQATSLLLGLSNTTVWDNDSSDGFLSVAAGLETSF